MVGPRHVGKTSLLERSFPELDLVSLDVHAHAEMAETRPEAFLSAHPPPVILDEVQYAPELFRHLKTMVDQRRSENGLFLLTGSHSFPLMESVSDSLAGRAAVIPFLGLSGAEWRAAWPDEPWSEFLFAGGYPGLWGDPGACPDRNRWYQGYVATYLERDVRTLLRISSLRDFERFLRACASRTGQLLNMAELGRDVGVSATTAREWINVLQASNLILLLEPYHRSLGKRLVKSPKLYFTDTGLCAYLMGFASAEALWQAPAAGALFETYVIGQWLRWRDWHCPSASLWFWQDRSGAEVDLVVEHNAELFMIECKLASRPSRGEPRGIAKMRELYGSTASRAWIACTTQQPHELAPELEARSGWTTWPLEP